MSLLPSYSPKCRRSVSRCNTFRSVACAPLLVTALVGSSRPLEGWLTSQLIECLRVGSAYDQMDNNDPSWLLMKTMPLGILSFFVLNVAAYAEVLIMPKELVQVARNNGCSQVDDFYDRPGFLNPPYVHGYLYQEW